MKILMGAAALLAAACTQKAPDPKDVARIESVDRISRREVAERARQTPEQRTETDRQVATAQLRAKLGAKNTSTVAMPDTTPGMGGDLVAKRFRAMRDQAMRDRKDAKDDAGKR